MGQPFSGSLVASTEVCPHSTPSPSGLLSGYFILGNLQRWAPRLQHQHAHHNISNSETGTSPVVQWLRLLPSSAGAWLWYPVRELRSLMPWDPPATAGDTGDMGLIPGLGRSPAGGNGNPLQYSCLQNSMDRGTWWAIVHGVSESDMTEHACMFICHGMCPQIKEKMYIYNIYNKIVKHFLSTLNVFTKDYGGMFTIFSEYIKWKNWLGNIQVQYKPSIVKACIFS